MTSSSRPEYQNRSAKPWGHRLSYPEIVSGKILSAYGLDVVLRGPMTHRENLEIPFSLSMCGAFCHPISGLFARLCPEYIGLYLVLVAVVAVC